MSSKRNKIEGDILKLRNEGNWRKASDSVKILSKKYGTTDGAVLLLEAEAELETYLQEFPPKRKNISKSKQDLGALKTKLQQAMSSDCKESIFAIQEEACILLCRLLYAQGNTTACIEKLDSLDFKKLEHRSHIPCYMQKLLCEVHALRGLCSEHSSPPRSGASAKSHIIEQYKISTEFFLAYVSEFEKNQLSTLKSSGHPIPVEPQISHEIEIALQRGPLLHMKNHELFLGIKSLQAVLQRLKGKAAMTIQQTLARDLATVLLRGTAEETYASPGMYESDADAESTGIVLEFDSRSSTEKSHAQLSTSAPMSDSCLHPTNPMQEGALLLILSEAMFNTDPILDVSPEYAAARSVLLQDARSIYNLLAVSLSKFADYDMFSKRIESSLKYSYDEFEIWHQYALSTTAAQNYQKAVKALKECCRIQPGNPTSFLLASKICFERLDMVEEGIEYASRALATLEQKASDDRTLASLSAKMQLAQARVGMGIGYSRMCSAGGPKQKVEDYRKQALSSYEKAHSLDPLNYKPILFMAVEQALDRQIQTAIANVKEALDLQPHDLNCLHLLALLLTANKQINEAFAVLNTACKMYPENISLLVTKCNLDMEISNYEGALQTCHSMMQIWKNIHEEYACKPQLQAMMDRLTSDGLSTANQSIGNELDVDAGSFRASFAVAASKIGHALSELEGAALRSKDVNIGGAPVCTQADIWLLTSDVYISLKRYDEALSCIQQASTLLPLDCRVFYMHGKVLHSQGLLADAEAMFSNTITLSPKHHKAMRSWASIACDQGRVKFAKKLLEDALKLNYFCHESWMCLGNVLQLLGEIGAAVECFSTALNLEATAPTIPFTCIVREM